MELWDRCRVASESLQTQRKKDSESGMRQTKKKGPYQTNIFSRTSIRPADSWSDIEALHQKILPQNKTSLLVFSQTYTQRKMCRRESIEGAECTDIHGRRTKERGSGNSIWWMIRWVASILRVFNALVGFPVILHSHLFQERSSVSKARESRRTK